MQTVTWCIVGGGVEMKIGGWSQGIFWKYSHVDLLMEWMWGDERPKGTEDDSWISVLNNWVDGGAISSSEKDKAYDILVIDRLTLKALN